MNRRLFLTAATLATPAIFAATNQAIMPESMPGKEEKNIFVHHVYFWLKNPQSKDDKNKLIEGLKKLSAVQTIKSFHIGQPAGTTREVIDGSYAVSWLVIFNNKADQDSYQTDPIHLKFVDECSSLWNKVIVYDSVDA